MDIIRGDWRFLWPENIHYFAGIPSAWDASLNSGMGQSSIPTLWITSYFTLTNSFSFLGLPWPFIGYLFWVLPTIVIGFVSLFSLYRYLFPHQTKYAIVAGILYITNTYFLSIFGGGQFGVSLAYSFAPLVLLTFLRVLKTQTLKNSILFGLILSIQLLFDPRIFYVTLIAIIGFFIGKFSMPKKVGQFLLYVFFLPLSIIVLLHAFWLLPYLLFPSVAIPTSLGDLSSFRFFSFADFSHTVAFLHPNWPENIFGKVYFLQEQFLLLPIVAFGSLLFLGKKSREILLTLGMIAFIGIFLAKGTNEPFGFINIFLFEHFPGMDMFRDPTKFYVLISLSYSLLIPYTGGAIASLLKKRYSLISKGMAVLLIVGWFAIIFSSFTNGNPIPSFLPRTVPKDYQQLTSFLLSSDSFYRTLWVPHVERYRYFSNKNPSIDLTELADNKKTITQIFLGKGFEEKVQRAGVRYVVVPDDVTGEIFISGNHYDEKKYEQTVEALNKVSWLRKVKKIGKIIVYSVPNPKDHFWINGNGEKITYTADSDTSYTLSSSKPLQGNLIFSERYDPYWVVLVAGKRIGSNRTYDGLNSFDLGKNNEKKIVVYYQPQTWLDIGMWISLLTIILVVGGLIVIK